MSDLDQRLQTAREIVDLGREEWARDGDGDVYDVALALVQQHGAAAPFNAGQPQTPAIKTAGEPAPAPAHEPSPFAERPELSGRAPNLPFQEGVSREMPSLGVQAAADAAREYGPPIVAGMNDISFGAGNAVIGAAQSGAEALGAIPEGSSADWQRQIEANPGTRAIAGLATIPLTLGASAPAALGPLGALPGAARVAQAAKAAPLAAAAVKGAGVGVLATQGQHAGDEAAAAMASYDRQASNPGVGLPAMLGGGLGVLGHVAGQVAQRLPITPTLNRLREAGVEATGMLGTKFRQLGGSPLPPPVARSMAAAETAGVGSPAQHLAAETAGPGGLGPRSRGLLEGDAQEQVRGLASGLPAEARARVEGQLRPGMTPKDALPLVLGEAARPLAAETAANHGATLGRTKGRLDYLTNAQRQGWEGVPMEDTAELARAIDEALPELAAVPGQNVTALERFRTQLGNSPKPLDASQWEQARRIASEMFDQQAFDPGKGAAKKLHDLLVGGRSPALAEVQTANKADLGAMKRTLSLQGIPEDVRGLSGDYESALKPAYGTLKKVASDKDPLLTEALREAMPDQAGLFDVAERAGREARKAQPPSMLGLSPEMSAEDYAPKLQSLLEDYASGRPSPNRAVLEAHFERLGPEGAARLRELQMASAAGNATDESRKMVRWLAGRAATAVGGKVTSNTAGQTASQLQRGAQAAGITSPEQER